MAIERLIFLFFLGESGLGKSTLIDTLFNADLYSDRDNEDKKSGTEKTIDIQTVAMEIVESSVRLRLNVVDTPGFGDHVNNEAWYVHIDQGLNNVLSKRSHNVHTQAAECLFHAYNVRITGECFK
jgi:septin 7